MLFSEVYGAYYNAISSLIACAVEGALTRETMESIVREKGFEESILTIPEALENQSWPLIRGDYTTPLEHKPTMPLTTLQKRWLKSLLADPRIRLSMNITKQTQAGRDDPADLGLSFLSFLSRGYMKKPSGTGSVPSHGRFSTYSK